VPTRYRISINRKVGQLMQAVMMLVVPHCLYSVAAKHPFCWALRRMMHRPLDRCLVREFLKANFWAQCEQAYLGGCEDERGEDELFFSEALA